jgi:hypothetical protein
MLFAENKKRAWGYPQALALFNACKNVDDSSSEVTIA